MHISNTWVTWHAWGANPRQRKCGVLYLFPLFSPRLHDSGMRDLRMVGERLLGCKEWREKNEKYMGDLRG